MIFFDFIKKVIASGVLFLVGWILGSLLYLPILTIQLVFGLAYLVAKILSPLIKLACIAEIVLLTYFFFWEHMMELLEFLKYIGLTILAIGIFLLAEHIMDFINPLVESLEKGPKLLFALYRVPWLDDDNNEDNFPREDGWC